MRTMAVTYNKHEDVIEIITIHPIKEGQKEKVFDAEKYIGIAAEKTERVVDYWEKKLGEKKN